MPHIILPENIENLWFSVGFRGDVGKLTKNGLNGMKKKSEMTFFVFAALKLETNGSNKANTLTFLEFALFFILF